jgi:tRNA(adenine34) deaminase
MTSLQRVRASAVCVDRGRVLCVRLRDPLTRLDRLFVPGGAIERGETPQDAAERETFEETGYRVRCAPERSCCVEYPYVWNGTTFDVTTHFVKARLLEPDRDPEPVSDAAYNEGALWLPLAEAPEAFAFQREMCGAILRLVRDD